MSEKNSEQLLIEVLQLDKNSSKQDLDYFLDWIKLCFTEENVKNISLIIKRIPGIPNKIKFNDIL